MSSDTADSPGRAGGTIKSVANTTARLAIDLLVITGWVMLLTLFFLQNAWPRWAFYALLLLGIGVYVTVTAAWRTSDSDEPTA
ncbi:MULTISPECIES: hypothetical protein [Natronorubrum]|uniref:DUF8119 domain-containing protein n=2 Tax=Natronorubrum bangense TaxID=61858 RepID=A0A4D6HKI3_9EURY|nr:hypothetical protein [Natronorubrum bangense]ELY43170.1 hypothetical protein C494_19272 [Natronorubrum bangense JCM 10635]QCC53267.1 hypothetical protein DV706_01460 [Natronorubrum bangense]QCC56039.1 hypothetical protein DV706_15810 [Natronorubrum bangense]